MLLAACVLTSPLAAGPAPETVQAFHRYIRRTEMRLDAHLKTDAEFLWASTPEHRARLRQGLIACEPRNRTGDLCVPRGLIHDWVGAVFIRGASIERVLAVVQDYDNHKFIYAPEVVASETLSRNGDDFKVRLRLLKRKAGVTVLLDTEHDVRYRRTGERCWRSRSQSTRIAEAGRGSAGKPPKDRGYLWHLNSYWNFFEADGGAYVECEAISLTRGIPAPFAWLLDPLVRSLPREALVNTLEATRTALSGPDGQPAPPRSWRKPVQLPDALVTNRCPAGLRIVDGGPNFALP